MDNESPSIEIEDSEIEKANSKINKELNIKNSYSFFELGDSYFNGLGVKKNYEKALEYFTKSIEINPDNCNSLYELGQLYETDSGVPINIVRALNYYKLANLNDKRSLDTYKEAYEKLLIDKSYEIIDNYLKLEEENEKLKKEIKSLRSLPGSNLYKESMEEFYENFNL